MKKLQMRAIETCHTILNICYTKDFEDKFWDMYAIISSTKYVIEWIFECNYEKVKIQRNIFYEKLWS